MISAFAAPLEKYSQANADVFDMYCFLYPCIPTL